MIYIYVNKMSSDDKSRLSKIFSYLDFITENDIKFIDTSIENVNCENQNAIITFGNEAYKSVAKYFVEQNIYKATQLLGNNIFDTDHKFVWYNFNYTVTNILTDDIIKGKFWSDLLSLQNHLSSFGFINNEPDAVVELNEVATQEVVDDLPWSYDDPKQINKEDAETKQDNTLLTIDVNELLNKVAESLDLSDPTLGKSLSLSEKIELNIPNVGSVFIYPSGERIKPSDTKSAHLSFKDTLGLIKMSTVFGADKITFHLKESNV